MVFFFDCTSPDFVTSTGCIYGTPSNTHAISRLIFSQDGFTAWLRKLPGFMADRCGVYVPRMIGTDRRGSCRAPLCTAEWITWLFPSFSCPPFVPLFSPVPRYCSWTREAALALSTCRRIHRSLRQVRSPLRLDCRRNGAGETPW